MNTTNVTSRHQCDAECYAYIIRYGEPEGCDVWAAREAAEKEANP